MPAAGIMALAPVDRAPRQSTPPSTRGGSSTPLDTILHSRSKEEGAVRAGAEYDSISESEKVGQHVRRNGMVRTCERVHRAVRERTPFPKVRVIAREHVYPAALMIGSAQAKIQLSLS